jgi:hypothetical protein
LIDFICSWGHGDVVNIQSDIRCTSWARHHGIYLGRNLMIWLTDNRLLWHALIVMQVCRGVSEYNWLPRVISGGRYYTEATHISWLHWFINLIVIIDENGITCLSM